MASYNTIYPPSTRDATGYGFKGQRCNGDMRINVKRSWAGFSRGGDFNENLTIGEFVRQVVRDVSTEDGFQFFQKGWYLEVQSGKKALDPNENVEMIQQRFNGGETVHAKVSSIFYL
ncbi:hypothetical protein MVEN_01972900 [Mycena venus]|uniref:Uncharacterized protein n=1 Tax=Mycena venus TaxID=2733690 RepID=A0A8H7CK57_9AGAR|nr:hypothetical protein MVEN_01972900 [Mycena venus]